MIYLLYIIFILLFITVCLLLYKIQILGQKINKTDILLINLKISLQKQEEKSLQLLHSFKLLNIRLSDDFN